MRFHRVTDSNLQRLIANHYDIAVFASGYEQRCTYVAKRLDRGKIDHPVVLGFNELNHGDQRTENDLYFNENWGKGQIAISANDEAPIYEILSKLSQGKERLNMLVDYSSMSRLWYAGVLNWSRYSPTKSQLVIDMVYTVGQYQGEPRPIMVINDILSVPGLEGRAVPSAKSVSIFGLGFDGFASLCVLDRLEPDDVYAYYAQPGAHAEYSERARSSNQEMISKHAIATLGLPLDSVELTFNHLSELTSPHLNASDITIIPMGPKPHVLAAILLAIRFEQIGCVRVSSHRQPPINAVATGNIIATTVEFRPDDRG